MLELFKGIWGSWLRGLMRSVITLTIFPHFLRDCPFNFA
jgi:hypothetical protein